MKHLIIFISPLLALVSTNTFGQFKDKYASKEKDDYYEKMSEIRENREFIPISIETTKMNPHNYITVVKVNNPAIYDSKSKYWDSVIKTRKLDICFFKQLDSIKSAYSDREEDLFLIPMIPVSKMEKNGNNCAIIYKDSKYDDPIYGGWGYWIALSNDAGKTWNRYYTGLTENAYYYFKPNSTLPLWKDSFTLQIESKIVQQITKMSHPVHAKFETIENDIAVQIDLAKIIQDSDKDGLTDIAENKMLLNPNNSDTDGDGINDFDDNNPRYKSIKTEKTILYKALIENFVSGEKRRKMNIKFSNHASNKKVNTDTLLRIYENVNLIVTDDPELQGLDLKQKTIIMSTKEYDIYKTKYPYHFVQRGVSQMFKCDKNENTFLISTYYSTQLWRFVIKKMKRKWRIFLQSSLIS
jgi:hypothetical protein